MNERADPRLVKRLSIFASIAAVFSVAVAVVGLAGWMLHITSLYTWGVGPVRMVPNTAVGFALLGVSLWLLRRSDDQPPEWTRKLSANAAAGVATLLGLLSLAEHIFGWNFGIDQLLLVISPADRLAGLRPGLMSSITASDLIILGIALLLLDWKTRRDDWPSQFLCIVGLIGNLFGLLALVLEPGASHTSMALPTVGTFFVLTAGVVCSRAKWALGGLLTSPSSGARLLRRAIPAGLLVVGLIGWMISKPLLTEEHFTWIEVSALAVLCCTMLVGFVGWVAFIVDRGESQRQKLEEALDIDKEQIDRLLDRIEEPQAEVKLRRKVRVGFAFAITLTCALGFLSWRMVQQAAGDAAWVAHTHQESTMLELALRHLVDVETGGRGFALTGNAIFLEPHETGKRAVVQDLLELDRLVVDPDQRRRIETLKEEVRFKIESATNVVTIKQNNGNPPTDAQLERGKQLMDAVRGTVAEMEAAEESVLEQRAQRARAAQRFTISAIVLGSLAGVIFLSVAGATVSREIKISARARGQVTALNADLERRVTQRTSALGESEGQLAGVIQSAMDSIITVDEEHRVVLFNGAAERTFLCTAAEAIGQSINRFIPQNFHGIHAEHIRRFADTAVTNRAMGPRTVLRAVRADGQEFQIEASISQVVTGGKKLFTVILRDVTERVQSEELRERLAAIVDSSDDAIISKTLDGTIAAWNHGAEKVFGYSSSEAVGKSMSIIMPPERATEESDILARIGRGLSVEHFETVRVRKDGKKIDVSVTISPIRDNNGVVIGASKVARDITDRKQAEATRAVQAEELSRQADELSRSRQAFGHQTLMLQSVLDSMTEGLAAADEQEKFVIWNTAAEKILGMGVTDLPSQQWSEHYGLFLNDTVTPFPPDQLPMVRAIRGEVSITEMFVRNPKIAEGAWIEVNAGPLKDKQGMVRGGVAAFRDITKSRADEREIRQLNDELEIRVMERTAQLEAANQELEAFSYSVSHDLRAPLRHIGGFSQLLTEEFGPTLAPEARRYLDRIQAGTQKMGLLVDELLNLARVGRHALNRQTTSLNAIVAEVIAMLEPESEGRQVQWVVADLPAVHCDPVLVKQIFQNLLANALKFTRGRIPAVIEVEISGKKEGGQSVFIVRDNGVGFDMKYVDKLFGVFQRLHRSEDFEGTGVGLVTVQRIVQKHGGRVWAEAEVDKGAAFYFTLGVGKRAELKSLAAMAGGQS